MQWMHALRLSLLFALLMAAAGLCHGRQPDTSTGTPTTIATVRLDQLPQEARHTLALIQQGGPFPYRRDGVEFQNREHRLPAQPKAYYLEYTVPTPGAQDRGPRRLIVGQRREYFYTDNHYRSFLRVSP